VKALKVLLHAMSWVEAKEYFSKNDIAILPVGSKVLAVVGFSLVEGCYVHVFDVDDVVVI